MRKFKILIPCLIVVINVFSQKDTLINSTPQYVTDRDSKFAVAQIVNYCGLEPNFEIVIDFRIKNAVAYIKKRKRFIKYNPDFMKRISDSTETDWAAWSVLAHELGHHLLGHTIQKYTVPYENELSADKFSGFILNKMGATLGEALICIETEGHLHASKTHPPKNERIIAITEGWNQANELSELIVEDFSPKGNTHINENFTHRIQFNNELTSYFINHEYEIILYDNYGNAILIGQLMDSDSKNYNWVFILEKSRYAIDSGGDIWLLTTYGSNIKVGSTEPLSDIIEK